MNDADRINLRSLVKSDKWEVVDKFLAELIESARDYLERENEDLKASQGRLRGIRYVKDSLDLYKLPPNEFQPVIEAVEHFRGPSGTRSPVDYF